MVADEVASVVGRHRRGRQAAHRDRHGMGDLVLGEGDQLVMDVIRPLSNRRLAEDLRARREAGLRCQVLQTLRPAAGAACQAQHCSQASRRRGGAGRSRQC